MFDEKESEDELKEGEDFTVTEGGPAPASGVPRLADQAPGPVVDDAGLEAELNAAEAEVEGKPVQPPDAPPGLTPARQVLSDFLDECGEYFDREVPITAPIADASELSKQCPKIMHAVVTYAATWKEPERVEEEAFLGAILCLRIVLDAREYVRASGQLTAMATAEHDAKSAERERQKKYLKELEDAQTKKRKSIVVGAPEPGTLLNAQIAAKHDAATAAAVAAAERIREQSKGNAAARIAAMSAGGNAARILGAGGTSNAQRILAAGKTGIASRLLSVAGAGQAAAILGKKPVVPTVAGGSAQSGGVDKEPAE